MALIIEQFFCRTDNFSVLIHDDAANVTAAIDAPEEAPIAAKLKERGWKLDHIFVTHHHGDHTEAISPLKAAHGCTVTAPAGEASKIPGVDKTVKGGDRIRFGGYDIDVIDTPGHTLGHISYHLPEAKVAFVADTLFAVGCGRVIEGTMEMMWDSLTKMMALPDDTAIYCGHEYTEANIRFALTIEPDNAALIARAAEAKALRAAGKATLPTTMAREKQTNPFLRVRDPGIRARLAMKGAPDAAVFGEIRRRKDSFK
ncbi:MAG TPA: hydroxyacylglutathione hydrolase [Bauldia sp.]|nr:hydroxyacylglutathione hydrolase [Bauldia sp.]